MRDKIKRDFGISNTFINRIEYLTDFSNLTKDNKSRSYEKKIESIQKSSTSTDINFCANLNCRYIGRYYVKNKISLWIGYDLRNNIGKRFYFQIFNPKETQLKKINNLKINYERIVSKIDQNKAWYCFYLDESLIYLQSKSFNTESDFDDAKQEIWETINSVLE